MDWIHVCFTLKKGLAVCATRLWHVILAMQMRVQLPLACTPGPGLVGAPLTLALGLFLGAALEAYDLRDCLFQQRPIAVADLPLALSPSPLATPGFVPFAWEDTAGNDRCTIVDG